MRINQPVTQREYSFPPDTTLVSVTDTKGRITYCNPAFVVVSGFTTEELMGQPHNIVRHPDMPSEAFRDMWDTLAHGRPWQGLVKNRRKDGDHYWVVANATPIVQNGQAVGYLSVRSAPTRQQVEQAEALYARMREEAAADRLVHVLRAGTVVRRGWTRHIASVFRPEWAGRIAWLQGGAALATGAAAFTLPAAAVAAVAGVAAAAAGFGLWRMVAAPMERTLHSANQLAACDLSVDVPVTDRGPFGELQRALSQLAMNLRTVVGDTRVEVEAVRHAVHEISAGNIDLSSRTESQASSLQQTAASMEELNGTTRQSAVSASQGADLARQMKAVAETGQRTVHDVAGCMQTINASSQRIAQIIHTVEAVAFQTNLLALNAAVEAARAGDAGRGFAVVAGEVRQLAGRAADAAQQIRQITAEAGERIQEGNQRTAEATRRIDEVLQAVNQVTTVLDEIATAAHQQQTGISQISEAVTQMDNITQQNAAMVEELAATSSNVDNRMAAVMDTMRLLRLRSQDGSVAQRDAVAMRKAAREDEAQAA
jgi:aerotaxis receptor